MVTARRWPLRIRPSQLPLGSLEAGSRVRPARRRQLGVSPAWRSLGLLLSVAAALAFVISALPPNAQATLPDRPGGDRTSDLRPTPTASEQDRSTAQSVIPLRPMIEPSSGSEPRGPLSLRGASLDLDRTEARPYGQAQDQTGSQVSEPSIVPAPTPILPAPRPADPASKEEQASSAARANLSSDQQRSLRSDEPLSSRKTERQTQTPQPAAPGPSLRSKQEHAVSTVGQTRRISAIATNKPRGARSPKRRPAMQARSGSDSRAEQPVVLPTGLLPTIF